MPRLDYPFVFECSNCDVETTVTRQDARDLYPDPDSIDAVHMVLRDRGWLRDEIDRLIWCPDCAEGIAK